MPIKLIAMDMDDTLLDPKGQIAERTQKALAEAMRRGVHIVLASGRMPEAMKPYARELRVNAPVIAFNGALTVDLESGEVVNRMPVENGMAREAARLAEERGGHAQVYRDGKYFFREDNLYARRYAGSIGVSGEAVGMPLSEWFTGDADKLLVIHEPENIAKWVGEFQAYFGGRLNCAVSRPNYIEICNAGADKAVALKAYCERLSISTDEAAAFGDGENDLSMIASVRYGYVMANAREPILARAPRLAPSNAEDGIAQMVEGWIADGTIREGIA